MTQSDTPASAPTLGREGAAGAAEHSMQSVATSVTRPAPRAVWEELLVADPHALVSQTPAWLDTLCAARGYAAWVSPVCRTRLRASRRASAPRRTRVPGIASSDCRSYVPARLRGPICPAVTRSAEVISSSGGIFSCTEHPLVPEHEQGEEKILSVPMKEGDYAVEVSSPRHKDASARDSYLLTIK